MNPIWSVLIASVLALLASRLVLARSKTLASTFDESASHVVVRRQRQAAYVAVVLTIAPWPLMPKVLGDTRESVWIIVTGFLILLAASCGGAALLALALRQVVVSREEIRVVGLPSYRFAWSDLRDIEAVDNGAVGVMRFVFAKKKIAVDSTFDGFRELVRALEVWPTGNAKELGQKAARVLAQWREDPKGTK
jgi:hypothetical protein